MAFTFTNSKNVPYYLHTRQVTLKNGLQRQIYFFAKRRKAGVVDQVPLGYEPMECQTGLPVLRKCE